MPVLTAGKLRALSASVFLTILFAAPGFAQDDEELPTLKLDRIPASPEFSGQTRARAASRSNFRVESVIAGLSSPWALSFLPAGEIIVTEYTGTMRIVSAAAELSPPLSGLPEISHEGWAGLFDIALDPDFARNQFVYFSYTAKSGNPDSPNIPRVARARLNREKLHLADIEILIDGDAWQELHFAPDGTLLVSGTSVDPDADSQDLGNASGKVLRINADGSIPQDNPWTNTPNARADIYSYGHRDISGFATNPKSGDIWITEHGPRGGDEVNIIIAGANYGWKVISYGTGYTGEPIGEGQTASDGMQQPVYFWRPSIAPSGLSFYSGDMFPEWRNSVFVTSLSGQHVSRLELEGNRVVAEERLLVTRGQRIRELREGPDGALYVLTNEEGDAPKGTAELLRIFR